MADFDKILELAHHWQSEPQILQQILRNTEKIMSTQTAADLRMTKDFADITGLVKVLVDGQEAIKAQISGITTAFASEQARVEAIIAGLRGNALSDGEKNAFADSLEGVLGTMKTASGDAGQAVADLTALTGKVNADFTPVVEPVPGEPTKITTVEPAPKAEPDPIVVK